jgi:hypothetical protein
VAGGVESRGATAECPAGVEHVRVGELVWWWVCCCDVNQQRGTSSRGEPFLDHESHSSKSVKRQPTPYSP